MLPSHIPRDTNWNAEAQLHSSLHSCKFFANMSIQLSAYINIFLSNSASDGSLLNENVHDKPIMNNIHANAAKLKQLLIHCEKKNWTSNEASQSLHSTSKRSMNLTPIAKL